MKWVIARDPKVGNPFDPQRTRYWFLASTEISKEGLFLEKLIELESAIEQRKQDIKNYAPSVAIIGISANKSSAPRHLQIDSQIPESAATQEDEQSIVDMMEELDESVDSPLVERV